MPEELVPPVVAVVVTSDPGEWFEACLESLCAQDYPNLALLVVDDASEDGLAARVAAVDPSAVVRTRSERGGFAAAANEALNGVHGATFLLFCHDDVVLDHGAVRALVEESFRSNAAIVGPKLLDAADPARLRQVGLGMHRVGSPAPRARPGELDQAQHDETREVFAVPGACTLVRADLFEALGGYDGEMTAFGEDVDLCWRAQVAGARVVVAPQARVMHHEIAASGRREVGDAAELRRRHELRAALKNYSSWHRALVVLELLALGLVEVVGGVASGQRERARRVVRSWRWNLAHRRSLVLAREHLRVIRQVGDHTLVARMVRPGRLGQLVRPEPSANLRAAPDRANGAASQGRAAGDLRSGGAPRETFWSRVRRGEPPTGQVVLVAVLVLLAVVGLRDVLFAPLPLVGQLVPMPDGTGMLGQYLAGASGAATTSVAPSAYGVVGLLGMVLGNSSATAWKLIEVGALAAGAIGVARLCKPFGSSWGRLAGAAAFAGLPFGWNAVATGDVAAAVTLGAAPFVLLRLARATGMAPFATDRAGRGAGGLVGEMVPLGLLLALLGALSPAGLLACAALAVPVAIGSVLAAGPRPAARMLAVLGGGLVVAFCCCLPWSAGWVDGAARWSALAGAVPGSPASPASLLRGHTGPVGAWWGAFGIAAAAGYALVVARGERLAWATSCWLAAAGAVAFGWAGSEGWLGAGGGAAAVLSAPAGAALAACCGIGVAAFERDVVARSALGWRQAAGGVAVLCLVAGALPALDVALGGRADLPAQGFDSTIAGMLPSGGYRALWLGDPRSLPGSGWQLRPGLAWYVTTDGLPGGAQVWPSPSPGPLERAATAVSEALSGATVDAGRALAPLGIRYVVVPLADAPELAGSQSAPLAAPPPRGLLPALASQEDLVERPVVAGAALFLNADWSRRDGAGLPAAPGRGRAGTSSSSWRELGVAVGLLALLLALGEGVLRRRKWDRPSAAPSPGAAAAELSVP
jgi:GT2 family glycosyltransferase